MERRKTAAKRPAVKTIRGTLLQCAAVILVLCILIFIAFSVIVSVINHRASMISQRISILSWMSSAVVKSDNAIQDYALTGKLTYFKEYDQTISEFGKKIDELSGLVTSTETAQHIVSLSNLYTAYVNAYINFYSNYSSMYRYYSRDYFDYYEQGSSIGEYIQATLQEIQEIEFKNSMENYAALISSTQRFSYVMLGLILAMLLALGFVTFRVGRDITKPLGHLAEDAEAIAHGNLEQPPDVPTDLHEIAVLSDAFTTMAASIRALVEKTQEQAKLEISYREIRYRALLAQVNPHFLFNALTCVCQSAMADGATEAVEMINHISTVLRYSLSNLQQTVSLADELRNVDAYMYLQKMRRGASLELNVRVDNTVDPSSTQFPWMILQPIVENSIVHGFEGLPYTGVIDLHIARDGDLLCITIEDNGRGVSEETVSQLAAGVAISGETDDHVSIGLLNIRDRLSMLYQGQAHFTIARAPSGGTVVAIQTPIRLIQKADQASS